MFIPDQIEVSFLGVKLHREAAYVTWKIDGTGASSDCRKAHKHRRLYLGIGKEICAGHMLHRFIRLKISVRARAPRVHNTFRNALVVKMRDFLAQNKIFKQRGPAAAAFQ